MTTKIIITPANHGVSKASALAGAPRTVRVVTVGSPPSSAGRGPQTRVLQATPTTTVSPAVVRTVLKRVYTSRPAENAVTTTTTTPALSGIMPSPPKKRQRLDHLTADQKNQRRKLKNRVAAQTARDRKKLQMDLLESRVTSLERQNDKLLQQNAFLQKQNELLSQQNALLLQRLEPAGAAAPTPPPLSLQHSLVALSRRDRSRGGRWRAAGSQPAQLGRLPGGTGSDSDQHADLLELISRSIFGGEEPARGDASAAGAALVGTAAEELEPSHDTVTEDPAQALLALLEESDSPDSPDSPASSSDGAVPGSPRVPAPESLELDVKPHMDDLCKMEDQHSPTPWSIFDDEPLDAQLDDQLLLFPQLVL
ncbi:transcriptional activator hacA-like [Amphibalanus amphitrite]|uniref:transcriptional activator hacA-like n=1 Tax=Amphibalanus amphitrite TaxID=1232801 RepID=UPI001C907A37|nr:transcriptional activator hacA-like [Amphibalanus amphitrite]